jgi:hypothetical protein
MHLSNLGRTLRTSGPADIFYPANSIVPYIGATPAIAGWTRWNDADTDFCLFGTAAGAGGRTAAAGTGIRHVSRNFSSAGGHTDTFIGFMFDTNIVAQQGTAPFADGGTVGVHTHGNGSFSSYASSLRPRRAQFNFLRSTTSHIELPPNALVFSQNAVETTQEFIQNDTTYISSGGSTITDGRVNAGPTSVVQSSFSASAGSHQHHISSGRAFAGGSGGSTNSLLNSGSHNHLSSVTITQTTFGPTVILRLFRALSNLPPTKDIIIGYVGNSANIPAPWFSCDGQNGTMNLRDRFVAINSTITSGTFLDGPTWTDSNRTTSTQSETNRHRHNNPVSLPPSSLLYGHPNADWPHNHAFPSFTFDGTPITAPKVTIQFIQYKG